MFVISKAVVEVIAVPKWVFMNLWPFEVLITRRKPFPRSVIGADISTQRISS